MSYLRFFYPRLPSQNSFPWGAGRGVTETFAATSSLLWVMFLRISVYLALDIVQNVFLLTADGGGGESF